MEDDDIDTEMTQATGALPGAAPGAPVDDLGALYRQQQAGVEKQIRDNMTALMQAQARLREQRVGPSAAERLFAISAALTRPTRTGQFGEMMGNLGTVLGAQEKEKRAAEMERESLLEKYGMQIGEKQLQLLQQGLTGTGQLYRSALAASKPETSVWAADLNQFVSRKRPVPTQNTVQVGNMTLTQYTDGNLYLRNADGSKDVYSPEGDKIGTIPAGGAR